MVWSCGVVEGWSGEGEGEGETRHGGRELVRVRAKTVVQPLPRLSTFSGCTRALSLMFA